MNNKQIINENFKQNLVIQQKDSSIEILNNTIDELLEQIYSKTEELETVKKHNNEVKQEKINMQEDIILNNKKFEELLKERDKFVAENEELKAELAELKKSPIPVHHDIKKSKFRLEDFQGKYVMHCKTLESAKTFCEFMKANNKSTLDSSIWNKHKGETCFDVEGFCYGSFEVYENKGYTILDFDNFDWEE